MLTLIVLITITMVSLIDTVSANKCEYCQTDFEVCHGWSDLKWSCSPAVRPSLLDPLAEAAVVPLVSLHPHTCIPSWTLNPPRIAPASNHPPAPTLSSALLPAAGSIFRPPFYIHTCRDPELSQQAPGAPLECMGMKMHLADAGTYSCHFLPADLHGALVYCGGCMRHKDNM